MPGPAAERIELSPNAKEGLEKLAQARIQAQSVGKSGCQERQSSIGEKDG